MTNTTAISPALAADPRGRFSRGLDLATSDAPPFDAVLADVGESAATMSSSPAGTTETEGSSVLAAARRSGTGSPDLATDTPLSLLSATSNVAAEGGAGPRSQTTYSPVHRIRALLDRAVRGRSPAQSSADLGSDSQADPAVGVQTSSRKRTDAAASERNADADEADKASAAPATMSPAAASTTAVLQLQLAQGMAPTPDQPTSQTARTQVPGALRAAATSHAKDTAATPTAPLTSGETGSPPPGEIADVAATSQLQPTDPTALLRARSSTPAAPGGRAVRANTTPPGTAEIQADVQPSAPSPLMMSPAGAAAIAQPPAPTVGTAPAASSPGALTARAQARDTMRDAMTTSRAAGIGQTPMGPLAGDESVAPPHVEVAAVTLASHLAPVIPSAQSNMNVTARSTSVVRAVEDQDVGPGAEPAAGVAEAAANDGGDAESALTPAAVAAAPLHGRSLPSSEDAIARPSGLAAPSSAGADQAGLATLSRTLQTITEAVSELAGAPGGPPAGTPATPAPSASIRLAPARSMTLQLSPANLGTVGVRLHLTGATLDVQLTVADPKTLSLITHGREALSTAIADQSYRLNSLTIQGADAAAPPTAGSHDSARSDGREARNTQDQAAGGSAGGNGSPRRPPQHGEAAPQRGSSPSRTDPVDDGLFV